MGNLSIREGNGYFICDDTDNGIPFYHQIASASGANPLTVSMPFTTTMPAASAVISGQKASNTPVSLTNSIGTVTTTGATVYGYLTRTNAPNNLNCYTAFYYIQSGNYTSTYGNSSLTIGTTANGRYAAFYEGETLVRLVQVHTQVSDSDASESDWTFPIETPDTNYAVFGANVGNNWYVCGSIAKTTTTASFRVWNETVAVGSRTCYLVCDWIKG